MYDAIVVGARCAGSPTAMLLARKGYRVLVVDRARFPSDTISTHYIHVAGTASLERWGLRAAVARTNCPPITHVRFDFGAFEVSGFPPPAGAVADSYCPRRTVLDALLFDAAADAGAEVREGFSVRRFLVEDGRVTGIEGRDAGGSDVVERARIVIGADGMRSVLGETVGAVRYQERPTMTCMYYSYWRGLPQSHAGLYVRPGRMIGTFPTNDDLTLVTVSFPATEFDAVRRGVERAFLRALDSVPELGDRVRAAERVERFAGTGDVPNFFRVPFGPGWALVGDAGVHKDPITAQGITDAFRDAELLAEAVDAWLSGEEGFEDALAGYQRARDEVAVPAYGFTCQIASLEPPPPDVARIFAAASASREHSSRLLGLFAGTTSFEGFFSPESTASILAAGGSPAVPEPVSRAG